MLSDDSDEALQTAKNGTMDHYGPRCWLVWVDGLFGRAVLEVEALRKLEVQLDGSTLEGTTEGVTDSDVNLRSVESSIARVEIPLARVVLLEGPRELLKLTDLANDQEGCVGDEYLFCSIPGFHSTQIVIRTCRQLKMEVKAEQPIYMLHEVEEPTNLILNLQIPTNQHHPPTRSNEELTCEGMQNTCVSSCTNRLTLVSPVKAPDASFLWMMPNSAIRIGSSL